jgi:UDP-N-acetylmuramate--alanine ligase
MRKKYIHFVGIKGVGMTPLAVIAKEAGCKVTGSDIADQFITDAILKKAKIIPFSGFSEKNIKNPDLVIITGAHGGYDNPEAKAAKEKSIHVITQAEAVGVFMKGDIFHKDFIGVSVAGTHGKTTTTAMIATILRENNFNPSYVIGTGYVPSLGNPGHFGKGKHFIAEADEYATEPKYDKRAKFLWQFPKIGVLTNIEFDHPDVYSSLEEVRNTFLKFTQQIDKKGVLVACGDDLQIRELLKECGARSLTYGFNKDNTYVIDKFHISGDHMFFTVSSHGMVLGDFMIHAIGEHNAQNALAAIVVCLELGVSVEKIKKGLLAFQGSKRRLEYVGELMTGAKVYDDYAHHPTEIQKTLKALRGQFPKKSIIAVFQPHTFSRTKLLFDDFAKAFEDADKVLLTDIYASLREENDPTVSSQILAARMRDFHKDIVYLSGLSDVIKYLNEKRFRSDTILVTMGAGDIYKISAGLSYLK